MNKLTQADLKYQAQSLPKVEPFDHEKWIQACYEVKGWSGVDEYCQAIRSIASLETPRDTIIRKMSNYLTKTRKSLLRLVNRLKQIELR